MKKGKKHKIAVFVITALMIVGMVFIVRHDKKVRDLNDANIPHHVLDTIRVDTIISE